MILKHKSALCLGGCSNSDGHSDFRYSHPGYFQPSDSYLHQRKQSNVKECADSCRKNNKCVGFNFRHGDKSGEQFCVTYKYLGTKESDPKSKAYVKCKG